MEAARGEESVSRTRLTQSFEYCRNGCASALSNRSEPVQDKRRTDSRLWHILHSVDRLESWPVSECVCVLKAWQARLMALVCTSNDKGMIIFCSLAADQFFEERVRSRERKRKRKRKKGSSVRCEAHLTSRLERLRSVLSDPIGNIYNR